MRIYAKCGGVGLGTCEGKVSGGRQVMARYTVE